VNELELLRKFFEASPYLALIVWIVFRQERNQDRIIDRFEGQAKVVTPVLEKTVEMLGRGIEDRAHSAALQLRMADLLQDLVEEKRRQQ
jgi:hypothetical protein